MNVQYEQQGNYLIHCIRTGEQEEIYIADNTTNKVIVEIL